MMLEDHWWPGIEHNNASCPLAQNKALLVITLCNQEFPKRWKLWSGQIKLFSVYQQGISCCMSHGLISVSLLLTVLCTEQWSCWHSVSRCLLPTLSTGQVTQPRSPPGGHTIQIKGADIVNICEVECIWKCWLLMGRIALWVVIAS